MGTISIWHWLIVLLIVLLIFGSKKLRSLGADLGGAFRGFRDSLRSAKETASEARAEFESLPSASGHAPEKREKTAS